MEVIYLDCTEGKTYLPDFKRRVKDMYFMEDPYFEDKYSFDDYLISYNLGDLALVRTTGAFPFNHEVHTPLYDGAYDFGGSMYLNDTINDILREEYPDSWQEEAEKFKIYFENKRDTLHFTLNGLVASSMYGNFDGRGFIIIEPLKYHIDETMLSLRPEDTFFKGNMELSDESVIIISDKEFEKIKDDERYIHDLDKFKVFVYSGENQVLAVRDTLNYLGYDSFMISNNYYTYGTSDEYPAKMMTDFINSFAIENNISQNSHYYSKERHEELELETERTKEIDRRHLMFVLEKTLVSEEIKNEVLMAIDYYTSYSNPDYKNIMKGFIKEVGLETIALLTREFNDMMIKENEIKGLDGSYISK